MELSVLGMGGERGRTSEDRHVWRWRLWLKPECEVSLYHGTGMTLNTTRTPSVCNFLPNS